ncbi:MAG: YhcB family protein [Gammaproteobacteria bacterium]|nr:YhcB family protein [Gammaproteobacteria bacterium]
MDWTISIVTFIIGALLGYFICKIQSNSDQPSEAQEAKNQQLQTELDQYKQDVEQHFSSSADLLNKMAQDYSKIYQHMAQSQQTLLPDSEPSIAPLFLEETKDKSEQPSFSQRPITEEPTPPTAQPNDYVQGSHGIINQPQQSAKPEKITVGSS